MPCERDIVERLRGLSVPETGDRYFVDTYKLMEQAANEIERLRRSEGSLALALHEHAASQCFLARRRRFWRRR